MRNFLTLKLIENEDFIGNYYDIKEDDMLGDGNFGTVYKATRNETQTVCALKIIDKSGLSEESH